MKNWGTHTPHAQLRARRGEAALSADELEAGIEQALLVGGKEGRVSRRTVSDS
jgi:hypothetical protein